MENFPLGTGPETFKKIQCQTSKTKITQIHDLRTHKTAINPRSDELWRSAATITPEYTGWLYESGRLRTDAYRTATFYRVMSTAPWNMGRVALVIVAVIGG